MDECRREFGDSFSVRFLGFERPMVLISDPAAIKALYIERAHGLPPGRNIVLEPILGSQSLLLQEGAEHLARRRLMLPPFHGERMRSYEAVLDEIVGAEIDSWPLHSEFPIHTRMQAITLEVILRVVFGVADGPRLERLRGVLATVLTETASPRSQLSPSPPAASAAATPSPASRSSCARSTTCSTPRSPSTAPAPTSASATTSSRC